jgi:rod shape determining protein RodA
MTTIADFTPIRLTPFGKLAAINWGVVAMITTLAFIGAMMQVSLAQGDWTTRAAAHSIRFGVMLVMMLAIACVDIRLWRLLAYPIYGASMLLLVAVEIIGHTAMGAQRWLDLGIIRLQPSELMKIAMVLAVARYYHDHPFAQSKKLYKHLIPLALVFAPSGLILAQPDLGTTIMIAACGLTLVFLQGLSLRWVGAGGIAAIAAAPIVYFFFLHEYQRQRVLTFLDPGRDPLGAGYHITQSKIAIGNGGLWGQGYMQGSQSQLEFLPEAHTDFVFTALLEEFGLFGGALTLALYLGVIGYGLRVAMTGAQTFHRLVAAGMTMTLTLYILINVAMIMGMIPAKGVPMPLLSHGGSAMLTVMIGYGLVLNAQVHRDARVGGGGAAPFELTGPTQTA